MQRSPVFEETYQKYLGQIGMIDYLAKAELLGVQTDGDKLVVPLYDALYTVSAQGIHSSGGEEPVPAVRVILARYVLHGQEAPPQQDDPFRTFRDFRDSSPLISYFTTNTNKTLENTFSGKIDQLVASCIKLGAVAQENRGYDCSMLFHALPNIPVVLNFNDSDELFPASCSLLYRASAERYLDMECLAMTGTLLAGRLVRP